MQREVSGFPLRTLICVVLGIAVADAIGKADWGLGFWPTWCIKIVAGGAAGLVLYYVWQWFTRRKS